MTAGARRIDLDGEPAGTVTPEDEKVAKARLASPRALVPPAEQAGPEAPAMRPTEENQKPSAPKSCRSPTCERQGGGDGRLRRSSFSLRGAPIGGRTEIRHL